MQNISFNVPPYQKNAIGYMKHAIAQRKICGDGEYTKRCSAWLEQRTGSAKVLLTTSCTHALEMAAMLSGIQPGDEVIMPSYTFVSTADAFVLRGAKVVFTDIRPDTMNIDERLIEQAITPRTVAIVVVHYAGVACEMDTIMDIAHRYHLLVIEDAAQGMMSTYKGQALGTIGDFGCYSFHETKNYSMGEGGALLIRDPNKILQAEIIREKGTNRSQFFRGEVDKYSWQEVGSSYLPSELNAAYLWAQLEEADAVNERRLEAWNQYYEELKPLEDAGKIELEKIPEGCIHNAHMFYVKVKDLKQRTNVLAYLKRQGIHAVFHYIPLHSAAAGKKYGYFYGEDVYTTRESDRLLRLPMYDGLTSEEIHYITQTMKNYWF